MGLEAMRTAFRTSGENWACFSYCCMWCFMRHSVLYSFSTGGAAHCSHVTIISDVLGTALPYSSGLSKYFVPD